MPTLNEKWSSMGNSIMEYLEGMPERLQSASTHGGAVQKLKEEAPAPAPVIKEEATVVEEKPAFKAPSFTTYSAVKALEEENKPVVEEDKFAGTPELDVTYDTRAKIDPAVAEQDSTGTFKDTHTMTVAKQGNATYNPETKQVTTDESSFPSWRRVGQGTAMGLKNFGRTLLTTSDYGKAAAAGLEAAFGPLEEEQKLAAGLTERKALGAELLKKGEATGPQVQEFIKTGNYGVFQPGASAAEVKAAGASADKIQSLDLKLDKLADIESKLNSGYYDTGVVQGSDIGIAVGELFGTDDSARLREMEASVYSMVDDVMNERSGTQTDRDELRALRQNVAANNTPEANVLIIKQMRDKLRKIRDYESGALSTGTAPKKRVVRKGKTRDGRTVVQYDDGSTGYVD